MLSELTEDRKYVLVYIGDCDTWKYFQGQNVYLGTAVLTDDLDRAFLMTCDEAVSRWKCMKVKEDWAIWSVKPGLVLNIKQVNHVIEEQIADLNKQVGELAAKIAKE
jgi:hypothetical protein